MTNLSKREIVDHVISLLSGAEFGVSELDRYFADEARIISNGTEVDYAEWKAQFEEMPLHFPDVSVNRTIEDGNCIAVWLTFTSKQVKPVFGVSPREDVFEEQAVHVFEIRDGEITLLEMLVDTQPSYEHFGVLEDELPADIIANQYLTVLNRVLRHDLRTSVNLINAHATSLAQDTDTDPSEIASQIQSTTDDLLNTAEKARTLQEAALDTEITPEPVDVLALAQAVLDDYTERATATCHTPASGNEAVKIETDRKLLRIVLEEVIENAVVHSEQSPPNVKVGVHPTDGTEFATELVVTDSGPGIPDEELAPVRTGEETQLLHGSGIGLWLVQWGVTRLHGDVSFDTETDGTTVRIRLPAMLS